MSSFTYLNTAKSFSIWNKYVVKLTQELLTQEKEMCGIE